MTTDWLVGSNRPDAARARLLGIAADLIAERGVARFDINDLAARAHCSRATIYRHTGGKKQLVETVFIQTAGQIIAAVQGEVRDTVGAARARVAITSALSLIREDRVTGQFVKSRFAVDGALIAARSPAVAAVAADLIGLDPSDTIVTSLAVRSFLGLLLWPPAAVSDESLLIDAMVAGLLGAQA